MNTYSFKTNVLKNQRSEPLRLNLFLQLTHSHTQSGLCVCLLTTIKHQGSDNKAIAALALCVGSDWTLNSPD